MAKRMTKAEFQLIVWLIVIGLPVYGIYKFGEAIGWVWFVLGAVVVGCGYLWYKSSKEKACQAELMNQERARQDVLMQQEQARRDKLTQKYGDEKLVEAIVNRLFWQGQTASQLIDSLGHPIDVDKKIMKTKKKEVWKYNHMGGNRFGLRITLENDVVVGWDEKT